jgi:hypothetical protein
MLRRSFAVATLALAITTASTSRGDIIYNNFGPGNSYDLVNGFTVGKITAGTFVPSMGFTVPSGVNFNLSEIDLAANFVSGTNSFVVSIRSDSGGVPDGTLESWTVTGLGPAGQNNPPVVVTSVLHETLLAGQQYWVTLGPGAGDSRGGWQGNSLSPFARGPIFITQDGNVVQNTTGINSAFRVLGTPTAIIPEPGSLVMAGWGVVAVAACVARRRTRKCAELDPCSSPTDR